MFGYLPQATEFFVNTLTGDMQREDMNIVVEYSNDRLETDGKSELAKQHRL